MNKYSTGREVTSAGFDVEHMRAILWIVNRIITFGNVSLDGWAFESYDISFKL